MKMNVITKKHEGQTTRARCRRQWKAEDVRDGTHTVQSLTRSRQTICTQMGPEKTPGNRQGR